MFLIERTRLRQFLATYLGRGSCRDTDRSCASLAEDVGPALPYMDAAGSGAWMDQHEDYPQLGVLWPRNTAGPARSGEDRFIAAAV